MTVLSIDNLSQLIHDTRAQEEQHRANMNACSGALQAYEALLSAAVMERDASVHAPEAPSATVEAGTADAT